MSTKEELADLSSRIWYEYLTTGTITQSGAMPFNIQPRQFRRVMSLLPSSPRCMSCNSPFEGIGGRVMSMLNSQRRSKLNPKLCNGCEEYLSENHGGADVPLSMLFADVRGSTTLAESMKLRSILSAESGRRVR